MCELLNYLINSEIFYLAHAGLELLGSSDFLDSAFQVAPTTDVAHWFRGDLLIQGFYHSAKFVLNSSPALSHSCERKSIQSR